MRIIYFVLILSGFCQVSAAEWVKRSDEPTVEQVKAICEARGYEAAGRKPTRSPFGSRDDAIGIAFSKGFSSGRTTQEWKKLFKETFEACMYEKGYELE